MHELPRAALPMLDVYLPMMRTAAVLAAGQLGLFAALASGPRSLTQLARTLRSPSHGLQRLCDLLVDAGFLAARRGGTFANAAIAQRWFTPKGEVDYSAGLAWTADAWHLMEDLAGAVRRGGPEVSLWQRMRRHPELGERFAAYMLAFARHASPRIAAAVSVPPRARRMLDIGGSHGLHSIAFCRDNPNLHAVVFDHAASLQHTMRNVTAHGLQHRITTQVGDCTRDPFGRDFDVVLYFSVAHNQSPTANRKVLRKCAQALNPGGLLVVHDYLRGHMPADYNAAFDLTLLLEVGTRTHTLADFRGWIDDAGLSGFRHRRLQPTAMGSIVTARKALTKPARRARSPRP